MHQEEKNKMVTTLKTMLHENLQQTTRGLHEAVCSTSGAVFLGTDLFWVALEGKNRHSEVKVRGSSRAISTPSKNVPSTIL